jgi:hypothetical protein
MSYNIYKVSYVFSAARNHYALFIETDNAQDGCIIHVTGDLLEGMQVEIKEHTSPQGIRGYLGKEFLGTMASTQLWNAQGVADSITPPWQQLDNLGRKIHPKRSYYRSEEWVNDVVQALKDWDILKT